MYDPSTRLLLELTIYRSVSYLKIWIYRNPIINFVDPLH
jgi:hypothetical protein